MKRVSILWYRMSIKTKCVILMGTLLTVLWLLLGTMMMQLHTFSQESSVIMRQYTDITAFMGTFSAENVSLEQYMRPSSTQDAREEYLTAIAQTDECLQQLREDRDQDTQKEYALKRAIRNAMEHYRKTQQVFLDSTEEDGRIARYLDLKTQATYIDGYARQLLNNCMSRGGEQWSEIAAANTRSLRNFTGFLLGATVLMCFVLMVFTNSIIKPLTDLGHAADTIGTGHYNAPPLEIRSMDELGRTARSFNLMQQEVRLSFAALEKQAEMEKALLEKELEAAQMQQRLQEGRFAQLQSQINPHFLFNTLNTIAALAREESAPLSEELILRLSSFFRYSLESDEKMVTLGREIRLLRDYIELQEPRYGDRIAMEIVSDPALEQAMVPKFILQPLVENAILHGMKACTGGGHIRVRVRRNSKGTIIYVTDNGCGFDTKSHGPVGEHHSVGLNNIAERMELSGGRLDIFSIPGVGTTARITVGGGAA